MAWWQSHDRPPGLTLYCRWLLGSGRSAGI